MREAFLALGILSATVAAAPASAQTDGDRAAAEPKVKKNWVKPEFCGPITEAYSSPRGPREALRLHSRENGFARPPAVSLQTALAIRLGVLETRIGVRAEQLNAWRDYTSALQELLRPPGDRSLSAAGHTEAPPEAASGGQNDPFAFEEKLAEDFAMRAAVAEKLKVAINRAAQHADVRTARHFGFDGTPSRASARFLDEGYAVGEAAGSGAAALTAGYTGRF